MSELPNNWQMATLAEFCSRIVDGSHTPPKAVEHGFPMLSARNIQERKIFFGEFRYISEQDFTLENSRTNIQPGDVLLTIVGTIGRAAVVPEEIRAFVLQRSVAVLKPQIVIPRYLLYALESPNVQKFLLENAKGTAQKGIYLKALSQVQIPIPPLNEQKRIAAKLDDVLSRVDAYRALLDRVPLVLKRFRKAVLAAAMSGRLTEEWRNERSETIQGEWKKVEFFDFCVLQRGYDLPLSQRLEGVYPIVTSAGEVATHSQFKAIGPGVVMGRSGSIGKVYFVEKNYWPHNTALYVKDFKGNLPKYVYYFLLGFNAEKFGASTAVPTLNRNNLRDIFVEVPPIAEQHEIVRRVEACFAYADRFDAYYKAARKYVNHLTPALLAKAFRGELVPQDPNDEPASVLLERIKAERNGAAKPRSRAVKSGGATLWSLNE